MRIKVSSSLVLGKMKNSDYLRFQKTETEKSCEESSGSTCWREEEYRYPK